MLYQNLKYALKVTRAVAAFSTLISQKKPGGEEHDFNGGVVNAGHLAIRGNRQRVSQAGAEG